VSVDVQALSARVERGEARAASELICAADQGGDIRAAVPALSAATASDNQNLAKEAVWALYTVARQGHLLGDARAALEAAAARGMGNAHLGLALDDLNSGKIDATIEKMDPRQSIGVQFGAAHALTDFAERTQDRALFERVLAKLQFGIVAPMLNNGVAASIIGQVQRTKSSFAGRALSEIASSTNDEKKSAVLFGVLMTIQERLR
jgi:hypothetical protein